MKKILLTGFMPFNGRDVNPSEQIVNRIVQPDGSHLIKAILPVEYKGAEELLRELVERERPDIILSVGQAGNVPHISVERVAINLDNTKSGNGTSILSDQAGYAPIDVKIDENGPNAYFSKLPVWELVEKVAKEKIPVAVSYSAGTYICNHVMYVGCSLTEEYADMISGFVHVPFLPEQLGGRVSEQGRYSMDFESMTKAIQTIVDYLVT